MSYRSFTIFASLLLLVVMILWRGGMFQRWAAELGVIQGQKSFVVVEHTVDGDTVDVRGKSGEQITVRMLGIDTPETVRPGVAVECGGPQASDFMKKLLPPGTKVRMVTDPTQDQKDKYGRTLAYLYPMQSQASYGEQTLRAGWAEQLWFTKGQEASEYQKAADLAEQKSRGVWSLCNGNFHSAG